MFTPSVDPDGAFTFRPLPNRFFEVPSPFGSGAQLILQKFATNSATLLPQHLAGIAIAAAQARTTFGEGNGALEIYGITDRAGSDAFNKRLSDQRAKQALNALSSAMGLTDFNARFSNGLGEQFEAEYSSQDADGSRSDSFRGVVCYLWESTATARDPVLAINVRFAGPPDGGGEVARLGPLNLGRFRATPRSIFA